MYLLDIDLIPKFSQNAVSAMLDPFFQVRALEHITKICGDREKRERQFHVGTRPHAGSRFSHNVVAHCVPNI